MKLKALWLLALCSLVGGAVGVAVMSVDLGSEWMKVAVVSPGVPMEIALNPESKRKTNVVVSIENGERKFGGDAMNVCVKSPKNCYMYLLDLLGKKMDNPAVQAFQKRFPHYQLEATDRGTVQFRLDDETAYSVEELLGMVLAHAKQQAEDFTQQKIKDAVITVPVFFNQAERLALITAGQLGGLNVLQLMNEPTAVALNYGMFRRKEINGTVRHMIFYDMGAQDTTATVVGYQIVKTKERGFAETHPQAQILGVGYDRTLGGAELKFRLREHLADEFNAMKKTKTDVRTVPRAMGKLLKEAERVKLILSANTECFAQVENVMEDIDFKIPMTRDKLVELGADLWDRVTIPLKTALDSAGMSMEMVDQVILIGGGSRVPKVQEILTEYVGRELGKNMNTDESAAMGAVYKAADLSTGFKVKKFITKDAVVFPVDVDFVRELDSAADSGEKAAATGGATTTKRIKRTLFARMNPYPQKKIMTFNKHVKDFTFYVNYNDLDSLGADEVAYLGSLNLTSVTVTGVTSAMEKNTGDSTESKGIKAHFHLDDSGILSVTSVEAVFEKTISVEEQEQQERDQAKKDEDTWSKLGDTISQFFAKTEQEGGEAGDKPAAGEGGGEAKPEEEKKDKTEKTEDKKADKKTEKEKKKEPKKPKVETVKEELAIEEEKHFVNPLSGETFDEAVRKLEVLEQADRDRVARETALNELQAFVFDLQDKIYQEEYESASTEEEREKMKAESSAVSDWLEEEAGPATELKEFSDRMKLLKDASSAMFARAREHRERPEMLESLRQAINSSNFFLDKSRNLTAGEGALFKEKELDALEKKIADVTKWRDDKVAEQEQTPLSEMPKLTASMIGQKIGDLDSEVKYLVQKAKMVKAEQERAKRLKEAEELEAAKKAAKEAAKEKKKKKADSNETEGEEEQAAGETTEGSAELPVPETPSEEKPDTSGAAADTQEDSLKEPDAADANQPADADADAVESAEEEGGDDAVSDTDSETNSQHVEL